MKKILLVSTLFALAAVSAQAQGTINFNNTSTTRIFTNQVVGGPAVGYTGPVSTGLIYHYALFCSTTATSVNGQTAAFSGGASTNYAFNNANWTLVTYGSNSLQSGEFISVNGNSTAVSGVSGGSSAQFVVVGWLANNIGTSISSLQSWFNGGNPGYSGWIGQSAVSGSITLGTSAATAATLFGASAPEIPGFTLGVVNPLAAVAPLITSQPTNETVSVAQSASFSVSASAYPAPTYQWMFNGTNTIAGATSPTLTINRAQLTNSGTYSAVISNTAGATNSFAATLTVNAPTAPGYVVFGSNSYGIFSFYSATKIFTNSAVGGPATGLTAGVDGLYDYALFVSSNVTSVLGQSSAILGSASSSYAFSDTNWTLVDYGYSATNRGGILSDYSPGATPIPGLIPGTTAQFVVIGWSANVGTSVADVQAWFNGGNPASNGWIGQSEVSGAITLGNGLGFPVPTLFATNAPYLQGFTLGLASPTPSAAYALPYAPPAIVQTALSGNTIKLSWLAASGSFGVQFAPTPAGPWSDTEWMVASDGANSWVTATNAPRASSIG